MFKPECFFFQNGKKNHYNFNVKKKIIILFYNFTLKSKCFFIRIDRLLIEIYLFFMMLKLFSKLKKDCLCSMNMGHIENRYK